MWPVDEVINIVPARKRRTSASDIDTMVRKYGLITEILILNSK
jgi:hypothetical protein